MDGRNLIQSIPNFSEGRDMKKVEQIVDCFRARQGVKLLDYSTDPNLNRCVVTVVGSPEPLGKAMVDAIGKAVELIDMNEHIGLHPRIGSVDVIPFIPLQDTKIRVADELARAVAKEAAERYQLPFYYYEESASAPYRKDISELRKGQFEGLEEKMKNDRWKPDVGPENAHPTAGAAAIGARKPIIYFNVNLDTSNGEIAQQIAKRVRKIGGGLHYVKALGVVLEGQQQTQVSMNITDFSKSSLYTALELVKIEAARYGVRVISTELVGFVPLQALLDCTEYYLQLDDFRTEQVIELNL